MASTFSDLKIELIGTGEQVGTWGSTTNVNLGTALEEAIVESADVAFSSSDVTLTLTNTNATQSARHLRLNLTGTSGGARNLILGSGCQIEKPYIINNGLADTVTVKNTTGTGIDVPAGKSMWVYNNGTNVVEVTTHTPVSSGGTGAYTLTANNVIIGNGTSAVGFVAPGSSGNLLTSNGTTWTSAAAPTTFLTGMIILWSGSIASIPSGFALCDGTSGTPDLRDRFVVGAGSTYAVDATGGSADATLPTHTHTATSTSTSTDSGHTHPTVGGTGNASGGGATFLAAFVQGITHTSTSGTSTANVTTTTTTTNANAGTSGTNANLPPYYALAYIMKT
jgi:microcystin-dependent protein